MATHWRSILGFGTNPDSSGDVFLQAQALGGYVTENFAFTFADPTVTGADIRLDGSFNVWQDWGGVSASLVIVWFGDDFVPAGNCAWEFQYAKVSDGGNYNVSAPEEPALSATPATPTPIWLTRATTKIVMDASLLSPEDEVRWSLSRIQTGDTMDNNARLVNLLIEYAD